jgi:acyl transferase domain-containing protein
MDPQQRLLLEVSWEALERAGYAPDRLMGTPTGVFIGMSSSDYSQPLLAAGLNGYDLHSLMGGAPCIAAGRLSYLLGLQGPSLAVDTACSSSLVALHLAVQSLRGGECSVALAGGVNANLMPNSTIAAARAEALAPDGRCKAFDAGANGYVRSDGCGVVVLKRLSDAQADGDTILALIRGTAVNQDGRSNGLTAPNGPSQTDVIRAALANGEVDPRDVTYVETHGTGTSLGDPIEAQALGAALGDGRSADQPIWIGSVKSNIGHLEAAAGVAGLMKLVLSLQHGQIPPSLHFKEPSPHIPWDILPLQVPTTVVPWDSGERARIGGVSSFGLSGTNAHAVVEAAPASEPISNERERPLHLLPISARTESALDDLAERYRTHLAARPAEVTADVTYTAGVGRSRFPHRLAVIGSSVEGLGAGLETHLRGATSPAVLRSRSVETQAPKVAFLFTGLGSQHVGMGRQLYETQPTFRAALEQCQEVLRPLLEQPLLSVLYPEEGVTSWLEDRAYGLPVVFAFEYALAQLWRSWGIEPTCVLGHSLGEYVAACVAGVFSLEDGLRLSAERARLVATLPRAGEMASVLTTEAQVASIIADFPNDVSIAAVNGPESVVVAGQSDGFQEVLDRFRAADLSVRTLAIPFAAHSPMLEPILDPFEQFAATIRYTPPRLDLISGRTGRLAGEQELTSATYWRRHLREPVRFADAVETLYAQGCRLFVEIGPAPVLLGLAQHTILDPETDWLPSIDPKRADWDRLLESLGALFTRGVDVDWAGFDRDYARRKVVLPTYPFQRERYWIDVAADEPRAMVRAQDPGLHPLLGQRLRSPLIEDHQFEAILSAERPAFLTDHRIVGQASLPATAFIEMAQEAAGQIYGTVPIAIEQLSFHEALFLPDDQERTVQVILTPGEANSADLRVYSAGHNNNETWQLHATGTIRLAADQASEAPLPDLPLEAVQARCSRELASESVYERLGAAGIAFGPRFRGLTRLWQGAGEALGQIDAPDDLVHELDAYTIHPALLDACFHALETALPDERPPLVYLMMSVDRVRLTGRTSRCLWSHVQMRTDTPTLDNGFVCDVRIYDEDLHPVAVVEGALIKGADPVALRSAGNQEFDGYYEVQWQPGQRSTDPDLVVAGTSWLILNDDQGVGDQLAALLSARGGHTILVSFGETFDQIDDTHWRVNPGNPDDFQFLLEDIVERIRHVPRIVNLWGLWTESLDELSSEDLGGYQILTCGSMLHLTQALARFPTEMAPQVWCVTSGVHPVNAPPTAAGVVQSPLWGLGRVIALEQPHLLKGLIDLDPGAGAEERAEQLLQEICSSDKEDQVALRGVDRYVARLVRREPPTAQTPIWRDDGAYLITGGLGSLGLQVAQWMAERGAKHLVLIGRRGLPERSNWDALSPDDPRSQQIAAIRAIETQGASVTTASVDVTDAQQMAALFARFGSTLPQLRGVIHAATSSVHAFGTGSVSLTELSLADFVGMLRAKVHGTWILHDLTRSLDLDFFVGFSSTTSLLGSRELGHYAAANAFLDAFVHFRRAEGLPGLTINWGSWETARTSATNWSELATRSGMLGLPADRALDALGLLVGAREPAQLVVAHVDWSVLKPTYEVRRARPFLALLGTASSETRREGARRKVDERAELLQLLAAAEPTAQLELMTARIGEKVVDVMALGSPETLDPSQSLHDLGLDSLFAVQLRNRLQADLQIVVPVASIIAGPSVAELAGQILEQIGTTGEVTPTPGPVDREATHSDANTLNVDLTHMSDEDIDRFLSEMLAASENES